MIDRITEAQVAHVRRLLRETELCQSAIALEAGVGRSTVWLIAHDRFRVSSSALRPSRCPECGARTELPCRACRIRRRRNRPIEDSDAVPSVLALELRPEDRFRYEEMRSRRLARRADPIPFQDRESRIQESP